MKRAVNFFLAVTAIGTALWWLLVSPNVMPGAVHERLSRTPAGQSERSDHESPRLEVAGMAEPIPKANDASRALRSEFRASNDYWEFAERIHAAAEQGDGASQYYLSVALSTCDLIYRYYFVEHRPGALPRIRTLDEAQQITTTRKGSAFTPDDVREVQGRCERIVNASPPPFGTADQWMSAAQASGYPLALANAAANKAIEGRFEKSPEKANAARSEARALIVEALQSKDADVVWRMGSTAAFLAPEEPGEPMKRQWIWLMAASLRDPQGDSMVEWRQLHCQFEAQCHRDDTVRDLIRRGAGNDLDEIERRARELNEKIDAGTFGESDI